MPDYKNGKIYKIECQETNRIYIGSTCQPTVAGRLRGHMQCLRRYQRGKCNYTSSFSILETGNYKCLLVCNYPCNTKDELTTKEAEYIRQYKKDDMCECVNKNIPNRTSKEYYKDNVDKIKQYHQGIKEKTSEWGKQYRLDNKEKITEYRKQYRKDNAEKIKEKVQCGCGGRYTMVNKASHERTKKHMKWEATQ